MEVDKLLDGRLKVRHLTLVTTIADHGSILRAAETLHVTQPVVTRALHELETILGVRLFERGARGVTPTIYGNAFLEDARVVLARLRHAGEQLNQLGRAEAGTVTVGTVLAGSSLLPQAILSLKAERPNLTVVVREGSPDVVYAALRLGEIDIKVGRLTRDSNVLEGLVTERLYLEPIRLVTRIGHPALTEAAPTLHDLIDYPWILPQEKTRLWTDLEDVFFGENLPLPANRVVCMEPRTVRQLLMCSDAIAPLPMLIARDDEKLALLATPLPSVRRDVGVVIPADRPATAATDMLLTHLREAASALRAVLT